MVQFLAALAPRPRVRGRTGQGGAGGPCSWLLWVPIAFLAPTLAQQILQDSDGELNCDHPQFVSLGIDIRCFPAGLYVCTHAFMYHTIILQMYVCYVCYVSDVCHVCHVMLCLCLC